MKKLMCVMVVLALVSISVAAFAESSAPKRAYVSGIVKEIVKSEDGNTVTGFVVTTRHNNEVKVDVDANTTYRKGKHDAATVCDVKVGAMVLAVYPGQDATGPAKSVKITSPAPAPAN